MGPFLPHRNRWQECVFPFPPKNNTVEEICSVSKTTHCVAVIRLCLRRSYHSALIILYWQMSECYKSYELLFILTRSDEWWFSLVAKALARHTLIWVQVLKDLHATWVKPISCVTRRDGVRLPLTYPFTLTYSLTPQNTHSVSLTQPITNPLTYSLNH